MSKKRVHIKLTEENSKEFDALKSQLGLNTKELVETSLDVLNWLIKKQKQTQFYAISPSFWNARDYHIFNFKGIIFFEAAP